MTHSAAKDGAAAEPRAMRNPSRTLNKAQTRRLLEAGDWGVMSTCGLDRQPYGVPLDYIVIEDRLYIHGSNVGHKIENIGQNPRVSFCVVGETRVVTERFEREFESVMVFGKAQAVVGREKKQAMEAFMRKYCPKAGKTGKEHLDRGLDKMFVVRLAIERMTGKVYKSAAPSGAEHF
jgi:hypothetical protein